MYSKIGLLFNKDYRWVDQQDENWIAWHIALVEHLDEQSALKHFGKI